MNANFTGNEIAQRRKALGLTQKELAEQLHVTDKAVSKWERGVNFPDLGLLENLAAALDITPAVLLGLETAPKEEVISTLAEIGQEELREARRELGKTGWICVAVALVLFCVYQWIPHNTIRAYYTLTVLIWIFGVGGIVQLFRHGQVRPWNLGDMACFWAAVLTILAENFGYLILDRGFPAGVKLVLRLMAAGCAQQLFCRTMTGKGAKALPLMAMAVFLAWLVWIGSASLDVWLCFGLCLAVYLLYTWRIKAA